MWIFAKDGFVSIVQYQANPDRLLVRSRVKGDLENYFPTAKVIRTPDHDYLYRTVLPKHRVAARLFDLATEIDYPKFKSAVKDKRRSGAYLNVWFTMEQMQGELVLD